MALMNQQERDGLAGTGVGQWPSRGAAGDDPVDEGDGLLVQWDHPFCAELAQRLSLIHI